MVRWLSMSRLRLSIGMLAAMMCLSGWVDTGFVQKGVSYASPLWLGVALVAVYCLSTWLCSTLDARRGQAHSEPPAVSRTQRTA